MSDLYRFMTPEQVAEKQARIDAETARIAALPAEVRAIMANVHAWHVWDADATANAEECKS